MTRDEAIFRRVYYTHHDRLFLFAVHLLGNEEQARDVVSGVFCHVWEHCESMVEATLGAYMQTMVRSRCLDALRHESVRHDYADDYLTTVSEAYSDNDVMEDNCCMVDAMLAALPAETGRILEMCYIERKKYDEVAALLGIHHDTVKRHIMRALIFLRENKKKFAAGL